MKFQAPNNRTDRYDLVSNKLSVTDPRSARWTYAYDDNNRLITVTDPLCHISRTDYDSAGNVTGRTDANNVTTTFGYDPHLCVAPGQLYTPEQEEERIRVIRTDPMLNDYFVTQEELEDKLRKGLQALKEYGLPWLEKKEELLRQRGQDEPGGQ